MNDNMNMPEMPVGEKPKSKTPMIIGIIAAVILCCCCGGIAAAWFFGDTIINSLNITY